MKRCIGLRGQALVEFAVTFPFVVYFLVFCFYAFLACSDYLTLQQMTREALRLTVQDKETALNSISETGRAALIAYHVADVNQPDSVTLVERENDAAPSEAPAGRPSQQLYKKSVQVTITLRKNDNIPNVVGFLGFLSEEEGLQFPPDTMAYTLDRRPE